MMIDCMHEAITMQANFPNKKSQTLNKIDTVKDSRTAKSASKRSCGTFLLIKYGRLH